MDDMNLVLLEGNVISVDSAKEIDGKSVMNFIVENVRKGGTQRFRYNCVAWNKTIEKFGDRIKVGEFVRITGHLQDSVKKVGDIDFHYSKVCVDFIDFD